MKTSPSSLKIRQIITQLKEGKLEPRPEFQRRLVWTSADKVNFVDTILKGYPFPEIYLANGEVNVETGAGTQLLVDGQQRVTTINSYFLGDPTTHGTSLVPYAKLEKEQKEEFLNYDVAVRDLGTIISAEIIEVFRRINATKYSLNDIEVNNAVYAGDLMRFAEAFAEHEFFDDHKVFRSTDVKRMGDVRFVLQVVITFVTGYFNRDEPFEEFLQRYNDTFDLRDAIAKRLIDTFSYIDECGFLPNSRIWKRSDLFSAIVEIDRVTCERRIVGPSDTLYRFQEFYSRVDTEGLDSTDKAVSVYAKAAIQATNDRLSRIRRGLVLQAILENRDPSLAIEGV